ncbi:MAG: PKD domain-containing protein [Bacteroidia bacterium]
MKNKVFLVCVSLLISGWMRAQMVGPNAYIKGNSVEIGVDGTGGFEGADTLVSPPLPGMHRRCANNRFGFVANPQLNSWLTYDGDFFSPGSPENGWGFEIGITGGVSQGNNCAWLQQINGAITNWNQTFNCVNVDWEGDCTSGTDVHFKINYFLQTSDLYYTTTVSITNNTTATIPDMYYYRNVDPDNNELIGFDFTTQNTVVSEPGGGCNLAHVCATSVVPSSQPQSYLGFAAIGANWRADYGGFSNRDASDLWWGTGFTQTVGATNFADEAISLAYRIQNLAPGATETFKFVVILDAASANNAVNNVLYFTYPGSATAPPSVCTPWSDTVRTCGGPVPIVINGPIVSDYTWTWSPAAGLSSTTGSSVIANPAVTTAYTAVGTPITSCVNPISMNFVVEVTPAGGNNPVIANPGVICQSDPPFNLTADSTGGTWLGPGITNSSLGTFSPAAAGPGTHLITYYTSAYCNNTDTINIVVLGTASATITQPAPVCSGSAPFNLSAAAPGGTWSGTGITSSSAGTFDPATAGTFTVQYDISGTCPSTDTVIVTVNQQKDATITQPPPQCISAPAFNLTAVDPGGTWSGAGITSAAAGTFNPATAGAGPHIITYTIGAPCGDVDTVIVTVVAVYNATIANVSPKCINAPAFNMSAASPGGTWTGAGITNGAAGTFDPSVAGPGVHMITYTISGLCGTTDTALVTVVAMPVISFTADTLQNCSPAVITFTGSNDQPGGVYSWNFGNTLTAADTSHLPNPSYTYVNPGQYTVSMTYTNLIGCQSNSTITNMITIHDHPYPSFVALPPQVDILSPTITFADQTTGNNTVTNWNWSFGDGSTSAVQNPTYTYNTVGNFPVTLIVTNNFGCDSSVTTYVNVEPVYLYYAPNAFTPNGDGNNDVFMVKGDNIDPDHFEMRIFNRWGEQIFRTTDLNVGWNGAKNNTGEVCELGVYVYKVSLKDWEGRKHSYIGHVTIVK